MAMPWGLGLISVANCRITPYNAFVFPSQDHLSIGIHSATPAGTIRSPAVPLALRSIAEPVWRN
jgi:hypothetical protein